MDLQNYTNVDIFRKVYEKRAVPEHTEMLVHPHNQIRTKTTSEAAPNRERAYNPYTNNMGTTIGKFALLAS